MFRKISVFCLVALFAAFGGAQVANATPPDWNIITTAPPVTEGQTFNITIQRVDSTLPQTVLVSLLLSSANPGVDYVDISGNYPTAAGIATRSFTVNTIDNVAIDGTRQLLFNIEYPCLLDTCS